MIKSWVKFYDTNFTRNHDPTITKRSTEKNVNTNPFLRFHLIWRNIYSATIQYDITKIIYLCNESITQFANIY